MRGRASAQVSLLCALNPEDLVPSDHPIRGVKALADAALARMDREMDALYSDRGRMSIPPERLLKAMVLMALYGVRSERMFCEQLRYNLLFRWFLDMDMTGATFDHSTFTNNRDRFLRGNLAGRLFGEVVREAEHRGLVSKEHFSVDGTLIEAWASMKSFRPKDENDDDQDSNGWSDFKGNKRSNDTHQSRTDPEAKLMRKGLGKEAKLVFTAHALMENRHGLLVDFGMTEATGRCERQAALHMLSRQPSVRKRTLGADAGYYTKDFIRECRELNVTPHVAQPRQQRSSTLDRRTTRHAGYQVSQRIRRRIEQPFGWLKTAAGFRKARFIGLIKTAFSGTIAMTAYNLLRMTKICQA